MSDTSYIVRDAGPSLTVRTPKTDHSRQSSITRPTKASEIRSVRSRQDAAPSSILTRQTSLRIPSTGSSAYTPSKSSEYRPTHVKTSSRTSNEVSRRPRSIDKSTSMYDMTSLDSRARPVGSLYISKQSASSNSLSSRTSPRRAGLGARTISPVEIQRSKRNSRILTEDMPAVPSIPTHVNGARKVSAIPSPIKAPPLSRSRPSPIPPVPALPPQIEELRMKRVVPTKGRDPFRSTSGSGAPQRHRSVTLSSSARQGELKASVEEKTSFTSPMKQTKAMGNTKSSANRQLQALTLPPFKVQSLSTPTIRKVNNMSQHLHSNHHTIDQAQGQTSTPVASIETLATTKQLDLITKDIIKDIQPAAFANSDGTSQTIVEGSKAKELVDPPPPPPPVQEADAEGKNKDVTGFFSRLSLSRSSSRSKLKKRQSSEKVVSASDEQVPQLTPERRRRLSLSWMKGKMSPFGSSTSVPTVDPGIPPSIPKSFTSESLVSQISQGSSTEATSTEKSFKVKDGPLSNVPALPSSTVSKQLIELTSTNSDLADEEMKKLLITTRGTKYLEHAQRIAMELDAKAVARNPVDVASVETLDGCPLNLYEKGEIIDYDGQIFFTGQKGMKKTGGRLDSALNINSGYDDDRGDYLINPGDHFAYRYEIIDVLGKGSFGQVLRCIDYKTGGLVAVKIIRNKQRFHAQALVEVKILKMLRQWDAADKHHLIKYTDHFHFRNHLCIATDLLGMNLYEYVKANEFKGCTLNIIRSFTQQILACLSLLKRERVIHCDLKPENILLVNIWESKIKIIDFGSSCFENEKVYTYIQSRFYRSPEVILGMSYGLPIDIWSMGCILAELFTGFPIFPGEDEQEQLACIMEVFGPPEKHLIENSTRKKLFFDSVGKPRSIVSSKGKRRKPSSKTLAQATKCNDEAFLDFLTKCLRWNPDTRLTPEEALNHPFITRAVGVDMSETPRKAKRFMGNQIPSLGPRPLPRTPAQQTRVKTYNTGQRSTSHALPTMTAGSPGKSHRRVLSNLPLPRERIIT